VATHLQRLATLTRQVLSAYITKNGPSDQQYWSHGSFVAGGAGITCWYCYDTPATAAAVISEVGTGSRQVRQIAISTYSHAIRTYEQPSGEIIGGNGSNPVGTGFFAVQLGISYLELKSYLSTATKALWANAIGRSADFLISSGGLAYYINGNVNLRQTEVLWLAWAITGQRKYYASYQQEYAFTLTPTAPQWSGYGIQFATVPTAPLGANGAGYLTESEGNKPGFDASYTLTQLDIAASLYVLTHSNRYIWLMNVLFNQLRPLVNSSYILDAHNGTRKNDTVAFLTTAPFVLLMSGDRPDLSKFWLHQLTAIHAQYRSAETFASTGFYLGMSNWLALPLMAVQYPNGILGKRCSPKQSSVCAALF
jgi:hypothetical protein